MESSLPDLEISQKDIDSIVLLCDIAKSNRAPLALRDVVALTTINATEEQLERIWATNELLNSVYALSSGFIVERSGDANRGKRQPSRYLEDMRRAQANLVTARRFSSVIRSENVRLISVSGSTSYQFARRDDDVDFFCVTARDGMWLFMLKALLLARIYGWRNRGEPPVCLSCVMDERRAAHEFSTANDPLFARDALAARVIHGLRFFQQLLGMSRWMRGYFPRLYDSKADSSGVPRREETVRKSTKRVINSYLYLTVGSYIRFKSRLLNRKLRSEGRVSSLFKVRLAEDHCIYESARYQELRTAYSSISRS